MKIFGKSSKRKAAAKWAGYLAAAFLLASLGVNGVVNPIHYIKNGLMHIQPLQVTEDEENLILELSADGGAEKRFLSFQMESQDYSFDLRMYGSGQETAVRVWKGWNCIDLDALPDAGAWTKIRIPKQGQETAQIGIKTAGLSPYRRVETGRMLYITLSFLLLAAFWEGVWWIKERYAQADEKG